MPIPLSAATGIAVAVVPAISPDANVLELSSVASTVDTAMGAAEAAIRNRRLHERYSARDLAWLRWIRLNSETDASLIDLSATGAQIETRSTIRPGSRVALTLVGSNVRETVSLQVLRCEISRIDRGLVYRGAGRFDRIIQLPRIDSAAHAAPPPAQPRLAGMPAASAETCRSKLVVRYADGGMVKGFSHDFHPSRSHFHLSAPIGGMTGPPIFIPMEQLKAIFFVRDFDGNAAYVERKRFVVPLHGRRLEVTFLDGELLVGATLGFRPHDPGFFLTPGDPDGNNLKVYVLRAAVRHIRYVR